MMWLDSILIGAAGLAIVFWAMLSAYILYVQRRRERAGALLRAMRNAFTTMRGTTQKERLESVRPVLERASRDLLMRCASERDLHADAFDAVVFVLAERFGLASLVEQARVHVSRREKWRRIAALRILARLDHPRAIELLGRATCEGDSELSESALALLGRSLTPAAVDHLLNALVSPNVSTARVAVYLDQSPQHLGDRLVALLDHPSAAVRQWVATLLARYPEHADGHRLERLSADPDPNVRKAAIQTLGLVGTAQAAECAGRLLSDPVPFVRAHAARALGELGRSDYAEDIAALLGDSDWWVRLAARESLEMIGTEVWPVLVRALDHPDRFVRNGAAEIVQNLGVLDNLIMLEAATDYPTRGKLDMLRRITDAGGIRLTESLVERAGPILGPRVRYLLDSIGLEHVGAA